MISSIIREWINIVEDPLEYDKEYAGSTKKKTAAGEYSKVTATITSHLSGKYTRMANQFEEIDLLEKQLNELSANAKDTAKEMVEELFDAGDALLTRYVDTKSLVITMSKDQVATDTQIESFDVDGFIDGLTELLDDEMRPAIEQLIKAHTTIKTKTRAAQRGKISVKQKIVKEDMASFWKKVKNYAGRVASSVMNKANRYEQSLEKLKSSAGAD